MTLLRISWVAVLLSFLAASVLELLVIPPVLNQFRAEWIVLTLIYWLLRHPDKIGIVFSFFVGILLDVISGSYLGIQALSCCVVSYLVLTMHQRLKMFPVVQQSVIVFFLISIQLMISTVFRTNLGGAESTFSYLWSAIASALMWPFVLLITDRLNFAMR